MAAGDVRGMDPEQSSLRSSSSASSSAHQQTTPTPARVTERQPSGGKKSKFPKFLSSSRNKQKDTEPSRGDGENQISKNLERDCWFVFA